MQKAGAGFAGFATWLDQTPAHPDILVMPDPNSVIQLPWRPEVAWVAGEPWMNGEPLAQAPRVVLRKLAEKHAAKNMKLMAGVEPEFHLINADGTRGLRSARYAGEALLRPGRHHAPPRCHRRDLLDHDAARLGPLSERPRGCERPVRDQLELQRRADHRRPARLLQVHGEVDRREARAARHLHAQALHQPHRQRLPRASLGVGQERQDQPLPRRQGRARPVAAGLSTSSAG